MNINEEANSQETNNSEEKQINDLNKSTENIDKDYSNTHDEDYKLGWNKYSEITNGRFAMIGFFAILIIELLSNKSFLQWSGIIN